MTYTYEDIASKAEWGGGLDEALNWFDVKDVPEDIRAEWRTAKTLKRQLDESLGYLADLFPEELL